LFWLIGCTVIGNWYVDSRWLEFEFEFGLGFSFFFFFGIPKHELASLETIQLHVFQWHCSSQVNALSCSWTVMHVFAELIFKWIVYAF